MKKFLLTMALVLICGATMAQNTVEFTFTRNGATVAVNGVEGVTATLAATSPSNAWNTGGEMADRTDVLCPNTNTSATSEGSPITYTLTVEGLNTTVTGVAFTHVAVNSGGNLQPSNNVDVRHCNFKLEVNGEAAGALTDQNIWIPADATDKTIAFNDLEIAANGTLTIKLTLYKGESNNGCFYGLTKITLTHTEPVAPEEPEVAALYHLNGTKINAAGLMDVTEPTYIAIKGVAQGNHNYYNYQTGDTETSDIYFNQTAVFVWEPVETGTAGSYYLRKLDAGYMQNDAPGNFADTKENAAVFTAEMAVEVESGADEKHEFNRDTNGYLQVTDEVGRSYFVRLLTGTTWLNIGDHVTKTQAPAFNNGRGIFTIYHIYALAECPETTNVTVKNSGDTDFATFYSIAPVELPEGITAYYIKNDGFGNGYVTLTADEDRIIPANTGVILATEATDDTEIALTTLGADVAPENGNLLKGTAVDAVINETAYVLGMADGKIGLYKASTTGYAEGTFLNNANKAYLPASAVPAAANGAAYYSFRFGEGTTGVEEVKAENGEAKTIYDLTGRRVEAITAPGIYIVNGKKTLVK